MKRTNIIKNLLGCFAGVLMFTACSEEELTPSGANDNPFAVPAEQSDETSQIRREFYEHNNIHLLFSDVLRKEYMGKDANGNDIWKEETLDLDYNLTSDAGKDMELIFIEEPEAQREAAALVEKYILPHLAKGGSLLPYSILLVNVIQQEDRYGDMEDVDVYANMRCLAISAGEWLEMDEDEQEEHAKTILQALIQSKFDYTSEAAEPFLAYCEDMYNEDIVDFIPDWDRNIEDIYALGMLDYSEDWGDDPSYDWFISAKNDFADFFDEVMNGSEEEFRADYGEYPILIQKYEVMKNTIIDLGYIF